MEDSYLSYFFTCIFKNLLKFWKAGRWIQVGQANCFVSPLSFWSLSTILNEEKLFISCSLHASHSFLTGFQSTPGLKAILHSCRYICSCWKLKLAEIIIPNVWRGCVLGTAWCILFLKGAWNHSTKQQRYQKRRVDVGFVVPPPIPTSVSGNMKDYKKLLAS